MPVFDGVRIDNCHSADTGAGGDNVDEIDCGYQTSQRQEFFADAHDPKKGLKRASQYQYPADFDEHCQADNKDITFLQHQPDLPQFAEAGDQENDCQQDDEGYNEFFQGKATRGLGGFS